MNIVERKNKIIELLRSTDREGIESVICQLERIGYFEDPASASHHLNHKGGLAEHSLNVCMQALDLREMLLKTTPSVGERLPRESVILASLLHDTCKAGTYRETLLNRKSESGAWVKVPGYSVENSDLPLGHGEKSVIELLSWGLKLTRDEMLAIRWHMTAWDLAFQSYEHKTSFETARKTTPLCYVVQIADSLASGITENGYQYEKII